LWTASGGPDYAGKPRPVLIIQADGFDATASVLVCLITSAQDDVPHARPKLAPTASNGLLVPSRAMANKLTAVPRSRLGRRIGRLEPAALAEVERALLVVLGLA
jgi:mRNA interferase MazF